MRRTHQFTPLTVEAARLLGMRVAAARRQRRLTVEDLAERVGVSRVTVHKIEHGDPTVGLGVAFEAAVILGVPLFAEDPERRRLEFERAEDRLALLPKRARRPRSVDDDF